MESVLNAKLLMEPVGLWQIHVKERQQAIRDFERQVCLEHLPYHSDYCVHSFLGFFFRDFESSMVVGSGVRSHKHYCCRGYFNWWKTIDVYYDIIQRSNFE